MQSAAMYRIIGVDGKEYGPVSADQLRKWIAEGRVNLQTRIKPEGAMEWQPLSSFPDLVPPTGITPPPPPPGFIPAAPIPASPDVVAAPAICLIIYGALVLFLVIANAMQLALGNVIQPGTGNPEIDKAFAAMKGVGGVVALLFGLACGFFILFGGLRMKAMKNHGLCIAASIFAMIPCLIPCCVLGIPLGIWSLVVLAKPDVKAAFHP
jgi:hypothetical protein